MAEKPDGPQDLDSGVKARIDALSRIEMARRHRFAPIGDPMFQGEAGRYFAARFKRLGGFSVAISKAVGWGDE